MTKRSLLISCILRRTELKNQLAFRLTAEGPERNVPAFFRGFPERRARGLAIWHGLCAFKVTRLQNDHRAKQRETNENFGDSRHRNSIDCFPVSFLSAAWSVTG